MSVINELNLYEKINAICEDLEPLRKDVKVQMGKGSYTAISHDNVTASISELLSKYRVIAIPNELGSELEVETYDKQDYQGNLRAVRNYMSKVTMQVRFQDLDSDNFIETQMTAIAHDQGDKPFGKAQSMATKYCYLKMFRMQTNSDEEKREGIVDRLYPPSEKQMKILRESHDKLKPEEITKLKENKMSNKEASSIIGRILNGGK